jgi:phage FluMu protein gp41
VGVDEMIKEKLVRAREQLAAYLEAERAVLMNQSYRIGTRSLTRADLSTIQSGLKYWKNEVAKLEEAACGRGRNRAYRVVPRDL